MAIQNEVPRYLRNIAGNANKLDLEKSTLVFKNSDIWIWKQSSALRDYYTVHSETRAEAYISYFTKRTHLFQDMIISFH